VASLWVQGNAILGSLKGKDFPDETNHYWVFKGRLFHDFRGRILIFDASWMFGDGWSKQYLTFLPNASSLQTR
jgi:hypothetical protein